jgi:hypothetical protein
MTWLKLDLRRPQPPIPHEPAEARARRLTLRERLLHEAALSGAAALAIAQELRALEAGPAPDSLQDLR